MHDLAVVMPVYNEADCIADVVQAWLEALQAQDLDAVLLLYNDGSTDDTAARLAALPPEPAPANFAEYLQRSFGDGLCDLFLRPYNRKVWAVEPEAMAWH